MTSKLSRKIYLLLLSAIFTSSCRKDVTLPDIGLDVASPMAMVSDAGGNYFYVLNGDINHTHNSGSILILDSDGNKISATSIPRLGRALSRTGNDLLVIFDSEVENDEETLNGKAQLFDLADPKQPKFITEWSLADCAPANVVAREGYPYFAVACMNGKLFIGELTDKRKDSKLSYVRHYPGNTRKAMHIDPKRGLLFAFVSDMGAGTQVDAVAADTKTRAVNSDTVTDGPDEIPDTYQATKAQANELRNNTNRYQFIVYDIDEAKDNGFPFKEFKDVRDAEPRWLYWPETNSDGTPDDYDSNGDSSKKYYRTNFAEAQPDPLDPDSFYLSHRGLAKSGQSEHANDIIKVTLNSPGNPRAISGTIPKTPSYFSFKRVFGFKGAENDGSKYFDSFLVTMMSGQKVVVINSFRDLVNFSNSQYGLAAATIGDRTETNLPWFTQITSDSTSDSYYRLALAKNGNLLSSSFFSDDLRLFNLRLGDTITFVKTID